MKKQIVALILLIAVFISCSPKADSKEILFVCTHGAARSPIAAAYFNKIAAEKGLAYHAVFRGTEPNEELTDETVQGLTNDEFEIQEWKPEKVSTGDIDKAYKVVTFDCTVASIGGKSTAEEWNGTPSISKDYTTARNVIKEKVVKLIEALPKG